MALAAADTVLAEELGTQEASSGWLWKDTVKPEW